MIFLIKTVKLKFDMSKPGKAKPIYEKALLEINERLKTLEGFETISQKSRLTRDQKFIKDITMMVVEEMMDDLPRLKRAAEYEAHKK